MCSEPSLKRSRRGEVTRAQGLISSSHRRESSSWTHRYETKLKRCKEESESKVRDSSTRIIKMSYDLKLIIEETVNVYVCFRSQCSVHLFSTTSSIMIGSILRSTTYLTHTWRYRSVADLQVAADESSLCFTVLWQMPSSVGRLIIFIMMMWPRWSDAASIFIPTVPSDRRLPVYSVPCGHCCSRLVHRLEPVQVGHLPVGEGHVCSW